MWLLAPALPVVSAITALPEDADASESMLSLPFALAPAAMLIVIAYAAVMRGSPMLRLWLLGHCLSLLPYAVVMLVSLVVWAVITSPLALVIARRRARKPT